MLLVSRIQLCRLTISLFPFRIVRFLIFWFKTFLNVKKGKATVRYLKVTSLSNPSKQPDSSVRCDISSPTCQGCCVLSWVAQLLACSNQWRKLFPLTSKGPQIAEKSKNYGELFQGTARWHGRPCWQLNNASVWALFYLDTLRLWEGLHSMATNLNFTPMQIRTQGRAREFAENQLRICGLISNKGATVLPVSPAKKKNYWAEIRKPWTRSQKGSPDHCTRTQKENSILFFKKVGEKKS